MGCGVLNVIWCFIVLSHYSRTQVLLYLGVFLLCQGDSRPKTPIIAHPKLSHEPLTRCSLRL